MLIVTVSASLLISPLTQHRRPFLPPVQAMQRLQQAVSRHDQCTVIPRRGTLAPSCAARRHNRPLN